MWKKVIWEGIETNYSVSKEGQVKNQRGKVLNGHAKSNGYIEYQLYVNGARKYALGHRIVALVFIPNLENKTQVNHINGIKTDNRVENLEWMNSSENNSHAWKEGLNQAAILRRVIQKDLNNETIAEFVSVAEASRSTGCHQSKIRAVANGDRVTTGGFKWEWKESFEVRDVGKAKKVQQLKNGDLIATYDSISEAARITSSNRKGIGGACQGKQKTCNDFEWRYCEEIVQ